MCHGIPSKDVVLKNGDIINVDATTMLNGYYSDASRMFTIQEHAEKNGYSVVRDLGGRGVGLQMHEEPFVFHIGTRGTEMILVPGMVFTIEPMINGGSYEITIDEENGWTASTVDGALSAQWSIQSL